MTQAFSYDGLFHDGKEWLQSRLAASSFNA